MRPWHKNCLFFFLGIFFFQKFSSVKLSGTIFSNDSSLFSSVILCFYFYCFFIVYWLIDKISVISWPTFQFLIQFTSIKFANFFLISVSHKMTEFFNFQTSFLPWSFSLPTKHLFSYAIKPRKWIGSSKKIVTFKSINFSGLKRAAGALATDKSWRLTWNVVE